MTYIRILLAFILLFTACAQSRKESVGKPMIAPEEILKDVRHFMYYDRDYLKLSGNYTTLDAASHPVSRAFATGNSLPLRIITADSSLQYKLYPLPDTVDKSIGETLYQFGQNHYKNYKREGEHLPLTAYADINGKRYSGDSTKGRILVYKFWFIHCLVCVQEMPELNRIVEKFKDRNDVLFISFAFDSPEKLHAFLEKQAFNYAVVSLPEKFISDSLKINVYPTHMIIGRNGTVSRVVDGADELEQVLREELAKKM